VPETEATGEDERNRAEAHRSRWSPIPASGSGYPWSRVLRPIEFVEFGARNERPAEAYKSSQGGPA